MSKKALSLFNNVSESSVATVYTEIMMGIISYGRKVSNYLLVEEHQGVQRDSLRYRYHTKIINITDEMPPKHASQRYTCFPSKCKR